MSQERNSHCHHCGQPREFVTDNVAHKGQFICPLGCDDMVKEIQYPPDHDVRLWVQVPEHIQEGIRLYIVERRPVGDFLTAVFSNDLREAFGRADHINQYAMHSIIQYLYNCAPAPCWGSPAKVKAWLAREEAK